MRILLVEDNAVNAELAMTILSAEGHVVLPCMDGAEALVHCLDRAEAFDLIVLDIVMPRVDGFTALSELRKHPVTCDVPVLCLTASALDSTRRTAILLEADEFLTKPYRRSDLLAAVAAARASRPPRAS